MTKKLSAIFIALLMIFALVSCFGEDDEDKQKEHESTAGLEYELSEDGSYYICTGIGSATADELVISSTYNNLPVKEIGAAAFAYNNSFDSITVPESIIAIGTGAFEGCNSLTFNVLNGGMYLGNKENKYYAFIKLTDAAQISSEFTMSDETKIMADAYLNNNVALTQITLGKGLTSVPKNAFSGCTSLTSINIPSSVTSIGSYAFSYCTSLKSIEIPSSVTNIDLGAFYNCTSLESVTFADGSQLESIGSSAFYNCTRLTSITMPSSVTSIGYYAFLGCKSLKSIEIPSGVTSIDSSAFFGCTSLESITIPNSVTSIGSNAFSGCAALQYNEYDNAYYLGNDSNPYLLLVKAKNNSITSININSNTRFIHSSAFLDCTSLKSIDIPSSITRIGSGAFSGCSSLKEMTIPFVGESKKTTSDTYQYPFGYIFGTSRYEGGVATSQYYYGSSTSSTTSSTYYIPSTLKKVTVTGGNILYGAFDDCSNIESIVIGEGVTSIGSRAFWGCESLTSIEIPSSVTSIDSHAFRGCTSLTSITIPNSVTSIGSSAFRGCTSLESITIPNSVTSIGEDAFSGCSSLKEMTIPFVGGSKKTSSDAYQYPFGYIFGTSSYEGGVATWQSYYGSSTSSTTYNTYYIPSTLKKVTVTGGNILYGAFYGCSNITSIAIGEGVTSIGSSAFSGCSSLKEMTIPFVGASVETSIDIYKYPFGYIFGTSSYEGGVATSQYYQYYSSSHSSTTYDTYYIPSTLKKVTVTGGNILYGAFDDCSNIESIVIGEGVTSIGSQAFWGCESLTSIEIPSSVTSIGGSAFSHCTSLESVTFADGSQLKSIGSSAFRGCTSLESIEIPQGVTRIGEWAFRDCASLESITVESGNTVYHSAGNCLIETETKTLITGCKNSVIPTDGSVTSIGSGAFYGCSNIESIVIGECVTSIGYEAFRGCTSLNAVYISDIEAWLKISFSYSDANPLCNGANLYLNGSLVTEVTVPNTITKINDYAFSGCTSLKSIEIPSSVTSIGSGVFSGCSSLKEMTIPFVGGSKKTSSDTYQYPFGYIFGTSSYEGGVATSQSYYGYSTSSTTYDTYYIPSTLKKVTVTGGNILYGAFYGCSNIESIVIGECVTSIGSQAFWGCESLTSIEIPSSVTSIGGSAFSHCTSLESVTFADGSQLKSIGSSAFRGCTSLESIEIPQGVTRIGEWAFRDCASLESITVESGNTVYHSAGNCLIETESKTLITGCKNSVIPTDGSVTSIGDYAFSHCTSLESIEIPQGVTSIGSQAFWGCESLTSIEIPSSVTSIGSSAFSGCSSLKEMTIPFVGASVETSIDIYKYPFGYIFGTSSYEGGVATSQYYYGSSTSSTTSSTYYIPSTLKKVTVTGGNILNGAFYGCSNIESIVIGDGVTSIGYSAFSGCTSLTSIEIPSSVTSIGYSAFSGCTSLESITVESGNTVYHSAGNCLIETETKTLIAGCKNSVIPTDGSVTSIDSNAFRGCTSLTSITIPNSVTSIGGSAFSGCISLTSITIPNSVTSISPNAFSYCYKLVEVYNLSCFNITKGSDNWGYVGCYALDIYTDINTPSKLSTTSDGYIFYSDGTNTYLIGYTGSDTDLTLPESYNGGSYEIYKYAFYQNDKITSVTISNSVTSIGDYAFADCTSLTIYAEAESQPSGWSYSWNHSGCPVIWGYKGE